MSFRRWETGDVIGYTKLVPDFQQTYQAPYYVIHRADFHMALHNCATDLGVATQLNTKVVDYDPKTPSINLEDGSKVTADIIIAADGWFRKSFILT
jgi:salicylate hydroxylase